MFFKIKALYAAFVLAALVFSACNESSTPTTPGNSTLAAPTNLQATSKDSNSVFVRWTPSADESNSNFNAYIVTYYTNIASPKYDTVLKSDNPHLITKLSNGVPVTIQIASLGKDNVVGSNSQSIVWAPADRFDGSVGVRLYDFSSPNGSGVNLFDMNKKPTPLFAADKANWNLGFKGQDNGDGKMWFGTGNALYPSANLNYETQIGDKFDTTSGSLDDVFNKQSLDVANGITYSSGLYDLSDPAFTGAHKNIVFYVRARQTGTTNWNYAKVLITYYPSSNGFAVSESTHYYIDLDFSYQQQPGVPYARVRS